MADSDEFIETTSSGSLQGIKVGDLASRLTSSFVFAIFAGFVAYLSALFEVPTLLIGDLFAWIDETTGMVFGVPEGTIEHAWKNVADIFPIAGPLDYAIGVVLVIVFFIGIRLMLARVTEGL